MSTQKESVDLTIAQAAKMMPIEEIAKKMRIGEASLFKYGNYITKIDPRKLPQQEVEKQGKLILVTAMSPTTAGEGKTTMSIGLADSMNKVAPDKLTVLALREPSLGPVFGMKGGATGGGYAQVLPMETINLHFTGDIHAIGAAGNLLAAILDNHIYQGNELNINPETVTWKRSVDMNDRQLREIESGLGSKFNGVPRMDGFQITVASEVMAIFCLAEDLMDLKKRLGEITVGFSFDGLRILAKDLQAEEAMTIILKDAMKPNLVQTIEQTPVLLHGGPFANIAHGCNSVVATKMGLAHADYVVTEAGFGSDLGAEKFMHIKMRQTGLYPDTMVVVGTIRALKLHAGIGEENLGVENVEAAIDGLPNLLHHYTQMKKNFGLDGYILLNSFPTDTIAEQEAVLEKIKSLGIPVFVSTAWKDGGNGSLEIAQRIMTDLDNAPKPAPMFAYELTDEIETKIESVVQKVYGGSSVEFSEIAQEKMLVFNRVEELRNLPICIAKTQYSLTDKVKIKNVPNEPFTIKVKDVALSTGAGFIIVTVGNILTMPGLPKKPAALAMSIDEDEIIKGLY